MTCADKTIWSSLVNFRCEKSGGSELHLSDPGEKPSSVETPVASATDEILGKSNSSVATPVAAATDEKLKKQKTSDATKTESASADDVATMGLQGMTLRSGTQLPGWDATHVVNCKVKLSPYVLKGISSCSLYKHSGKNPALSFLGRVLLLKFPRVDDARW